MIEELIENIIDAENQAEDIVKASVFESKKIIAEATENAEKIVNNATSQIKQTLKLAKDEASILSSQNYDKIIEEGKNEAEIKVENAEKKMKKAVDFIIRSYKKEYGNS